MIDYNKVALASLVLDASESTWIMEGSTTKPMSGAGDLVLSSKRQSYAEYDRDLLRKQVSAAMNMFGCGLRCPFKYNLNVP
jgi:hypothetical protein